MFRPEQLVGAHIDHSADTGVRGRRWLLSCADHEDLLDMFEQIIGPDIIMWGSQVFSKPAGNEFAVPWHQDGQYWPMRPLATEDVELKPGQVSLHDALLVHGSNANTSGKPRCGFAIRYMPATSLFDRSLPPIRIAANQVIDFSQRPIWLFRGEDCGGNDFRVGHQPAQGGIRES